VKIADSRDLFPRMRNSPPYSAQRYLVSINLYRLQRWACQNREESTYSRRRALFGENRLGDATMRSVSPSNTPSLYRILQKTSNRKSAPNWQA